ncbi:S-layer homology domain-containing protein [Paenibacillus sp. R14(2021)]|uniref:S-layer homology domain-containing protein n=1 Tax=Paenibacillus sp. R14(2021) TaxID=2859228 RepID=UPI001C61211E|nr:S-layer homology domain-containing protein [Paenibacillus sp. R14(2021)]
MVETTSIFTRSKLETAATSWSISPYALDAARAAQQAGIIGGQGNGRFAPKQFAMREETAKMLAVFFRGLVK